MDVDTIDRQYDELTDQSRQTIEALTTLAQKLQAAAQSGDQNAREWSLDLKEIAIGIRDEQNRMTALLQAIHGFAANQLQSAPAAAPQPQQPAQQFAAPQQYQQAFPAPQGYPQQGYPQPGYGGAGGGTLHRFLGGNFGSAIASGAGFGIGDELISHLFN